MCGNFPVPSHSTQPADLVELLAGLCDGHVIIVVPKEQECSWQVITTSFSPPLPPLASSHSVGSFSQLSTADYCQGPSF